MIRIRINQKKVSDVTSMNAKGWRVSIYRDANPLNEMVTVEKDAIKFMLNIMHPAVVQNGTSAHTVNAVQIKKYVHGYFTDSKIFMDTGSGINGTICISEGKSVETTYAFFRSEELQELIDEFGLKRVSFPKDTKEYKFDKIIQSPATIPETKANIPNFHTDGTYEKIKTESGGTAWKISGATYVYEYNTCTLTIPWEYNLWEVRRLMSNLLTA